jgi:hypothetical protein
MVGDLLLAVESLLLVVLKHNLINFLLKLQEESLDEGEDLLLVLHQLAVYRADHLLLELVHLFLRPGACTKDSAKPSKSRMLLRQFSFASYSESWRFMYRGFEPSL